MKLKAPTLTLPTVPKHVSRIALISAAVVLTLLVLGAATVHEVRVEKAQRAAVAAQKQKDHDADVAKTRQIQTLQAQLAVSETKRGQVCGYVKGLQTAKATRTLVTVPAVPCQ